MNRISHSVRFPIGARYINRQVLGIFLAALAVLMSIALGDRLIRFLEQAASGGIPGDLVLYLLLLRMPEMFQLVLPFALYIALLMGLGRLYSSQEMAVLRGGGMNTSMLLVWLTPMIALITLLVGLTSLYITPNAKHALEQELDTLQQNIGLAALQPGVFRIEDDGEQVTYSDSLADDDQTILGVFIQRRLENGEHMTVWAERGKRSEPSDSGRQTLVLEQGRRYQGSPGSPAFEVMSFDRLSISIETEPVLERVRDVDSLTTNDLDATPAKSAERHWRIGLPIFCLILALMAIAKSSVQPRTGQFAGIGPGLVWMLGYYLALVFNRWLLEEGLLNDFVGIWPTHLLFGGYAIATLRRLGMPASD
jgi:lipopolysaccharide export system permease protein